MAGVDSLLSLLAQQGANELRLGTDREPRMLAWGAPKRLSIPSTPRETLLELLGDVLDPQRQTMLAAQGRLDFAYDAAGLGTHQVRVIARPDGFDVVIMRS